MPNKKVNRQDRERIILSVLEDMADNGIKPELTAYGLARRMDMVVSYVLYAVLADMAARHLLTVRDEAIVNRCTRTFYSLPEGAYTLGGTRTVKINGKVWSVQRSML
jgi:hypothetical protein